MLMSLFITTKRNKKEGRTPKSGELTEPEVCWQASVQGVQE